MNQAPYPQIVIIPHKSDNANNFKLSLGDQEIGFSQRKGLNSNSNLDLNLNGNQIEIVVNNKKRKEALIRASEKQSLMLKNLMDAMHRHQTEDSGSQEDLDVHMEAVLKRQAKALDELKNNVVNADPDDGFTSERLTLLEDASHRQLDVLEDLVNAVQRLHTDKGTEIIFRAIFSNVNAQQCSRKKVRFSWSKRCCQKFWVLKVTKIFIFPPLSH